MRGPKPYGEVTFFIVVRGPVPRDLHRQEGVLGPTDLKRTRDVFPVAGTMARDRPSPYDGRRSLLPRRHRDQEVSPTHEKPIILLILEILEILLQILLILTGEDVNDIRPERAYRCSNSFSDEHFARRRKGIRVKSVKVNPTTHRFPHLIAAIPINCLRWRRIVPRWQYSRR